MDDFAIYELMEYDKYFSDDSYIQEMSDRKKRYNDKMIEIYNDKYINRPKSINIILNDHQQLSDIYKDVNELSYYVGVEFKYSFEALTLGKVKMGLDFAKTLLWTKLNKFDQNTIRVVEIESLLESMDIEDSQLNALKGDPMEIIHRDHEIVKLDRFDFHRFSKIFIDLRSHGDLILNYLIPFHNSKFNQIDNCVYAEQLPEFYRNRNL